ncbi:MAG: hypothetical protein CMJ59_08025 [Planctomycetaceae bacterium]|nr:hypothetical protein [Planctomycetaceae bacterium]
MRGVMIRLLVNSTQHPAERNIPGIEFHFERERSRDEQRGTDFVVRSWSAPRRRCHTEPHRLTRLSRDVDRC